MKRVRGEAQGFTIVETLIFLGVAGALFATTILMVGGQQRKAEFNTVIRELDSKIQSVMGNVSTGYYNSQGGATTCTRSGDLVTNITSSVAGNQGQNGDCVFVGQMFLRTATGFDIYSIVSSRLNVTGNQKTVLGGSRLFSATRESYSLPTGITIQQISYNNGANTASSFATVTNFASYSNNKLVSGSASVSMYTNFGGTEGDVNTTLANTSLPGVAQDPPGGIVVCITDQSRFGRIQITNGITQTRIGIGTVCS